MADLVFWAIVAAMVYMTVRPGSPAVSAIDALTQLMAGTLTAAVGQTPGE